jgi:hypothetical protein
MDAGALNIQEDFRRRRRVMLGLILLSWFMTSIFFNGVEQLGQEEENAVEIVRDAAPMVIQRNASQPVMVSFFNKRRVVKNLKKS